MDYVIRLMNEEEILCHSGIKGMKWGVRRYQNPDGSLTEAGKKRYYRIQNRNAEYQDKVNKYTKKAEKIKGKIPTHYLTDTGRAIAERRAAKAAGYEGKAIKYQKRIANNNKKLSELKPENIGSGKRYFDDLKQRKPELLQKAKKENKFNMEFLEMYPDDLSDTSKVLKEYNKFLTDPEKWMNRK